MNERVVVITGASAGIGAVLAEKLAARGDRVVLAARREKELREVAARCGANALPVVTDVTRRADVERLRDAALERFGHIDVWVNNAGRGITIPPSKLTDADVDETMQVNFKSALYGIQAVLPHFKERGRGQVINVSSMLGRLPLTSFRSAYIAAKHALNGLTGAFRQELRAEFPNIVFTTVSPAVVSTDFGLNARGGGPDSRLLPSAQPVEEVADVMIDVIDRPRVDVYTRQGAQQMVADYYASSDMAQAEAAFYIPAPTPAGKH